MLNFPSLLPTKIDMDKLKPRLRITPLGDGYVQREADGLNTLRHYFTVSFTGLSEIEKDSLINFVTARAGLEPFLWYHPGEKRYFQIICSEWQANLQHSHWTVVVRFEEDFNPV